MLKFDFERYNPYKRRDCPIYYLSDKILLNKQNRIFAQSNIVIHHNGPNTAVAYVYISHEWPASDQSRSYIEYIRHFMGRSCLMKAKSWCNYMLNNPPGYVNRYKGTINAKNYIKLGFK